MGNFLPPQGYTLHPESGLYYTQEVVNDPTTGSQYRKVTWFDSNTGSYTVQNYPLDAIADTEGNTTGTKPETHVQGSLSYGTPVVTKAKHGPRKPKRTPGNIKWIIISAAATILLGVGVFAVLIFTGKIDGPFADKIPGYIKTSEEDSIDDDDIQSNNSIDDDKDNTSTNHGSAIVGIDNMEFAIGILDDLELIEYDKNKDIWTPTRINLPKFLTNAHPLSDSAFDNPYLYEAHGETESFRYTYREHEFQIGDNYYDFLHSYGVNALDGSFSDLYKCSPTWNGTGENRDYSRDRETLANYISINNELYYATKSGIYKFNVEENEFEKLCGVKAVDTTDAVVRISAYGDLLYIAIGKPFDASEIYVITYDTITMEQSDPYTISTTGYNIQLYAGFVVDDEGELLFNDIVTEKVNGTSQATASIVSCKPDGVLRKRNEFGTLDSVTSVYECLYITLMQNDWGIFAFDSNGIEYYDFSSHSISKIVDAADALVWRADGHYIYHAPEGIYDKNSSAGYITTTYVDYSNHCVYRTDILTGSTSVIDMTPYHNSIANVNYDNLSNTGTDDPESNIRIYDYDFIFGMDRNQSICGYYDDFWAQTGRHFLITQIDDVGSISCKMY